MDGFLKAFQVHQRVALIKVGCGEIVANKNGVIVGVNCFFKEPQLIEGVPQVIPGCIRIGLLIDVFLIKSDAFFLTVDDVKAERSEEHTSELQSLMSHSYDVCCLKKH